MWIVWETYHKRVPAFLWYINKPAPIDESLPEGPRECNVSIWSRDVFLLFSCMTFLRSLPPKGSQYGIFTYIYHNHQPNVGKYTSLVDPMGHGKPAWNTKIWGIFLRKSKGSKGSICASNTRNYGRHLPLIRVETGWKQFHVGSCRLCNEFTQLIGNMYSLGIPYP